MDTRIPARTISALLGAPGGGACIDSVGPAPTLPFLPSAQPKAVTTDTAENYLSEDAERELHIADTGRQMLAAYERFQAFGNPHDRDEAVQWQYLQQEAIRARSEAQRLRMEQVIDEGCDYFQTEGQRSHRMLLARGLA